MRIAVLSDIHGNYWALGKVLSDIDKRSVDLMVNLGDSLYGPLRPKETYDLIRSANMITISGNEDRLIVEKFRSSPTLNYVTSELNPEVLDWLAALPKTCVLDNDIFLCHGIPDSDSVYLIEQVCDGHITVKEQEEIEEQLNGVNQTIVFCGHSHLPHIIQTSAKLIVNPGSVGCPAYDDDFPISHKVENLCNHTRYCIVEIVDDHVFIDQISIPYDFEQAVDRALKNNRPDWAKWLQTGCV